MKQTSTRKPSDVFALRLRAARVMRNMPADAVGKACFLSGGMVRCYERGQSVPNIDAAFEIARALAVPLEWLLGIQEAPEGSTLYQYEKKALALRDAGTKIHLPGQ